MDLLLRFIERAEKDARITTAHISLYLSLWKKGKERMEGEKMLLFRNEITSTCKISSSSTFHKVMRELHEYGYIHYEPSFNHAIGSAVKLL